jgi:hypothetical protein
MPLLTYVQTRPWAKSIREQVLSRTMPPWFAKTATVEFENDPRLAAVEIATVREWADSGAPAGNEADAPAPIAWPDQWSIGKPDLILRMPKPVHVPAREEIDYQYIVIPLRLAEDRWVHAVEIRPEVRGVVHHAVAYVREPSDPWERGPTKSDILGIYTPGQPANVCRPGMARKIPAGSDIVLQMHYTPNGSAAEDRTEIGVVWAEHTPEKRVITLQLATADLHIPPGDPDYKISVSGTLPNDALLLSMFPHMHLRGKAFEYSMIEPGGEYRPLLHVEPYQFEWQLNYVLSRPLPLKKGTRLRCTAWYDNSANNPRNPDPAAEIGYGEQSRDEMMVGFFDIAVPAWIDKKQFFNRSESAAASSPPPGAR